MNNIFKFVLLIIFFKLKNTPKIHWRFYLFYFIFIWLLQTTFEWIVNKL
jgi:hypothetical protein